jgi:hypothetical protein
MLSQRTRYFGPADQVFPEFAPARGSVWAFEIWHNFGHRAISPNFL